MGWMHRDHARGGEACGPMAIRLENPHRPFMVASCSDNLRSLF
jgi:hypothetical protein